MRHDDHYYSYPLQVKKAEIRQMMIDIDKETSSTILFDEFVEMATPKMQSRDTREEIMKVITRAGLGWVG